MLAALAVARNLPWRLIGILVGVVFLSVILFRGDYYKGQAARSSVLLDRAVEVNKSQAAVIEETAKAANHTIVENTKGARKKAELDAKHDAREKAIDDVPLPPACTTDPALLDELNSMRPPEGYNRNGRATPDSYS